MHCGPREIMSVPFLGDWQCPNWGTEAKQVTFSSCGLPISGRKQQQWLCQWVIHHCQRDYPSLVMILTFLQGGSLLSLANTTRPFTRCTLPRLAASCDSLHSPRVPSSPAHLCSHSPFSVDSLSGCLFSPADHMAPSLKPPPWPRPTPAELGILLCGLVCSTWCTVLWISSPTGLQVVVRQAVGSVPSPR